MKTQLNPEEIYLDKNSKVKLYRQIFDSIAQLIDSGSVPVGIKLPSVRDLSASRKISKNTVTKAYSDLEKAGYLYSQAKSGFYAKIPGQAVSVPVKDSDPENEDSVPTVDSIFKEFKNSIDADEIIKTNTFDSVVLTNTFSVNKQPELSTSTIDTSKTEKKSEIQFSSGAIVENRIDKEETGEFSLTEDFLASIKHSLTQYHNFVQKKTELFGFSELRVALASFLYKYFEIDANPSQIVVGSDINQLLYNILSLPSIKNSVLKNQNKGLLKLAEEVNEKNSVFIKPVVAMCEDPNDHIKNVFLKAKIDVREIPSGSSIMNYDFFITSGANLAFLSSDDLPNTEDSSSEFYSQLLDWAKEEPYRYILELNKLTQKTDAFPVKKLDTSDKVIYFRSIGSFFSSITTTCFAILPKKIAAEYKEMFKDFNCPVSYLEQSVLTDFIISGKLYNYLEKLENL